MGCSSRNGGATLRVFAPETCPLERGRRPIGMRAVAIAAIVVSTLLVSGPVSSQETGPGSGAETPEIDASRVESLVETLRDDAAREELILKLEVLLEAQGVRAADPPPSGSDGMGLAALSFLSRKAEAIGSLAGDAARFLADAPAFAGRLAAGVSNPEVRAEWLEFLVKLVLIVGAGFLVEWLVIRLIARPRFELREREGDSIWVRGLFLVERTLLDLAPVGAFGIAAYGALALVAPGEGVRVVALIIVNSNLVVRAVTVLSRMVLRPRYSSIRFVALSDATANYLYFWVRRFVVVSVYGFYIADAVLLLGAGRGPFALVQNLVGLLVAAMFVMLVLQNRTAVRTWIAGSEPSGSAAWGRVRSSFAEIWHVLAISYTVAVFVVFALELEGGFDFLVRATVVSLVTGAIAYAAITGIHKAVERGFRVNEETRQRFPSLEERVNRNRGFLGACAAEIADHKG